MDKKASIYTFTVDVESDWGGRTKGTEGIKHGFPIILSLLRRYGIKGLFFISTEVLEKETGILEGIKKDGHAIGSHGHRHICFRELGEAQEDKEKSCAILNTRLYRAPKFYYDRQDSIYSNPKGHYSLLRNLWYGKTGRIFYMHPFDIVRTNEPPPNLFCWMWYSRPEKALERLEEIVAKKSKSI